MNEGPTNQVERTLLGWSSFVRARAREIVVLTPIVVGLLGWYTARNLRVDTDTSGLVSDEIPYRRIYNTYQEAFPGGADQLVVVVEARTPGLADRAASLLAEQMRLDTLHFESVYAPGVGPFWERNSLLYMPTDSLAAVVGRVGEAAGLLLDLERDPTLRGLASVLEAAFAADSTAAAGAEAGADLAPVLGLLTATVFAASEGRFEPVPWSAFVDGRPPDAAGARRTLTVSPRLAFDNRVPGAEAVERVREIAREHGLLPRLGVRVLLTGSVAIEAEELATAVSGVRQAGFLALVSVALILFLALRSLRLILASLVTLGTGLVVTGALASVTVGSLNLISVAFAVLYVGLGIDYAIHLCLRYRARRAEGLDPADAIDAAVCQIGPSLVLSALTTAACFYAFLPTDFIGVSELGLIGGNGMFVSLFVTLTVLPALLTVFPPRLLVGIRSGGMPRLGRAISRGHRPILGAAALLTVVAALGIPKAGFDHNTLNLRDPASESVTAYRALLDDPDARPLSLSVLRADRGAVDQVAAVTVGVSVVEGTRSVFDFLPNDQEAKLELLEELADTLGPAPDATGAGPGAGAPADGRAASGAERSAVSALERLKAALNDYRWRASPEEREMSRRLFHVIRAWERRVEGWPDADRSHQEQALESAILGSLTERLIRMREASRATPLALEDLPRDLTERWIGTSGEYRVEIVPAESLVENDRLHAYVDGVRAILPDATGEAVSEIETGRVAVASFQKALSLAAIATIAILAVLQRKLTVVLLVVAPLVVAGVWTAGLTGWLGLPFNFANVIALPLLLGVGVDNSIHMVHQAGYGEGAPRDPMVASTSRAVMFATLTTMASFGNLAFALHVGMASMGRLLTLGMACVLLATLVLLPAGMAATRKATGAV